jgi:hypothetical protein
MLTRTLAHSLFEKYTECSISRQQGPCLTEPKSSGSFWDEFAESVAIMDVLNEIALAECVPSETSCAAATRKRAPLLGSTSTDYARTCGTTLSGPSMFDGSRRTGTGAAGRATCVPAEEPIVARFISGVGGTAAGGEAGSASSSSGPCRSKMMRPPRPARVCERVSSGIGDAHTPIRRRARMRRGPPTQSEIAAPQHEQTTRKKCRHIGLTGILFDTRRIKLPWRCGKGCTVTKRNRLRPA